MNEASVRNVASPRDGRGMQGRPTVLIVDDDPVFRTMLEEVLLTRGVDRIMTASDGLKGLECLDAHAGDIDFITLDLSMPNLDGVAFIRSISEKQYRGRLVLITSEHASIRASAAKLAGMYELNCVAALAKPVDYHHVADLALTEQLTDLPSPQGDDIDIEQVNAGLRHSRLYAYYQPRFSFRTGRVCGAEALARMRKENGELMHAGAMINLAEENGRITDITWRMIENICEEAGPMFAGLSGADRLSFNISGSILANAEFPEKLNEMIQLCGMSPQNFTLELTETRIPSDASRALELLTRLRMLGFGLAIDDFGTGYSGIKQLKTFPFSELKMDQSFVRNAATDGFAKACIEAGLSLARELGLTTVAEGVEDEATLELMRELGFDEVQGYLLGKAMPFAEYLSLSKRINDDQGALPLARSA